MKPFGVIDNGKTITLFSREEPTKITASGRDMEFIATKKNDYSYTIKLLREIIPEQEIMIYFSNDCRCYAYPVGILDQKYCYKGKLGVSIDSEKSRTEFKIWAPGPQEIYLELFELNNLEEVIEEFLFERKGRVRKVFVGRDLTGYAYRFRIEGFGTRLYSADPYGIAATKNGTHSVVFEQDKVIPDKWEMDKGPDIDNFVDCILYETHVKDFSTSWTGGLRHKGKYMSFTEHSQDRVGQDTAVGHLKKLGVTHVHLLPVQDFKSVDEGDSNAYNWGYDPYLYNVPEGSYSTEPENPKKRIIELKELIKSLHDNNIGIILDVVYNHTYELDNPFQKLVPFYYYRITEKGALSNGSGCGNEVAAERNMVRHFIIQSLKYWVKHYHIDGFRFDLMALLGVKTMNKIVSELRKEKNSLIIYGEPWIASGSSMSDKPFIKGSQKNLNIAVFNDEIRNALKGPLDNEQTGFVSGAYGKELDVCKGIIGEISYSALLKGFASEPTETINYCSAHDNLTLIDKLIKSSRNVPFRQVLRMAGLALGIVLTSQGIPFLHSGSEMCRTKLMDENSYRSKILVNEINYLEKYHYHDLFNYVEKLIAFRKKEQLLRLKSADEIRSRIKILHAANQLIALVINGDDKELLILHNASHYKTSFSREGSWQLKFFDFQAIEDPNCIAENEIEVTPISSTIAVKKYREEA
ncbi:MAG: type I pullulanase [Thermotogota bacterium]|nr:type I pullulanase [Thermotogota bacterium]